MALREPFFVGTCQNPRENPLQSKLESLLQDFSLQRVEEKEARIREQDRKLRQLERTVEQLQDVVTKLNAQQNGGEL